MTASTATVAATVAVAEQLALVPIDSAADAGRRKHRVEKVRPLADLLYLLRRKELLLHELRHMNDLAEIAVAEQAAIDDDARQRQRRDRDARRAPSEPRRSSTMCVSVTSTLGCWRSSIRPTRC
jgi:pyruvate kinase